MSLHLRNSTTTITSLFRKDNWNQVHTYRYRRWEWFI